MQGAGEGSDWLEEQVVTGSYVITCECWMFVCCMTWFSRSLIVMPSISIYFMERENLSTLYFTLQTINIKHTLFVTAQLNLNLSWERQSNWSIRQIMGEHFKICSTLRLFNASVEICQYTEAILAVLRENEITSYLYFTLEPVSTKVFII